MAEFFGDIERLAADLYPYRWAISAAIVIVAAVVAWYAVRTGWHMLLWRFRKPAAIVGAPLLVLFGFVAYDLGPPLFTNVTVEEEFPFAFGATVPAGLERSDVEEVMAGMAMVDDPVMEEAMPASSSISAGSMMAAGEDVVAMGMADVMAMTGSGAAASEVVQTTMAEVAGQMGEATQVASGSFKDADAFHRGSGQAIIYSAPGGGHLLRLEALDVTNGPALHVILSTHKDPTSGDEVKLPGYADLGPLKGNRGNQNYTIPADVDVSAIRSVVVYCKPFSVVFSVATLSHGGQ